MDKRLILSMVDKLKIKEQINVKALVGFDGFVDEVVHVVKKRKDTDSYTREETLFDYGMRISSSSGFSSSVEIVSLSKKLGGNGPILANALMKLGTNIDYIGAVGYPSINPIFESFSKECCTVIPVCQPASTDAVEFDDGKIIRCKLSEFRELTFDNIKERVGLETLAMCMDEADLIGFVNWALPPFSGQIWQGILQEVVPMLSVKTAKKTLFFDLADPASRPKDDLKQAVKTIIGFSQHYKVVLGLNLSEAVQVAQVFGQTIEKSEDNLRTLCDVIMKNMSIDTVVIHPVKCSCCMSDGKYYEKMGPYCEHPKLTTGAGDNFNAGFILSQVMGLDMDSCLLMGMGSSGFYVRNGVSGSMNDVKSFLISWARGEIE